MKATLLCLLFVSYLSRTRSAITSTPGIQRKSLYDFCTFQWTVTPPLTNCVVYNMTTGINAPLSSNGNYTADEQKGIVTLTITNIQLWDAGNYSLSVNTGTNTQIDSGALLFVYGNSQSFINQTAGPVPPTQGQTVELTCTVIPTSLPVAYRLTMYYFWYIGWFHSTLKNISSGPAIFQSGDVLTGYSIKNNGRTLVIDSPQYPDTQWMCCYGQEEGSMDSSDYQLFHLQLRYQPSVTYLNPSSGKFNADIWSQVYLRFSIAAVPSLVTYSNWSFVNTAGQEENLPPLTYVDLNCLDFNLSSAAYYGIYSITVTNSIGSTTIAFQVLPRGPPDIPSNFNVYFASHFEIALEWNNGWDNGYQQTTFINITTPSNETVVATWNVTIGVGSFNASYTAYISDNIEAETDYEARIWSTNALGSSDVIKLTTRTLKQPKLLISAQMITLNGSQATINYSVSDANIVMLSVAYCVEFTGQCSGNSFDTTNKNTSGQIIYSDLLNGDVYLFNFTAYAGNPWKYCYYAAMVNGLRIARNGDIPTTDTSGSHPPVAVIVLAVLLGVSVLAHIGCLVAFLVWKCKSKDMPSITPTQPRNLPRRESLERESKMTDGDSMTYEVVDRAAAKDDSYYTSVVEPPASAKTTRY